MAGFSISILMSIIMFMYLFFIAIFVAIILYLIISYTFEGISIMCMGKKLKYKNIFTAWIATVYKGNIIKNLIMDCQSYTKYRPNETTGGIFVSWRRKEELPTGA